MPSDGTITRAAPGAAATSWNAADWTFAVILSTGAPVVRHDQRGAYHELLEVAGATIPDRIPLLDSHDRTSLDRRLGEVTDIHIEVGQLVGTARLSRHAPMAARLAAEIGDGAKYGVSIGYAVSKWVERSNPQTKQREKVATAFNLLEASLVAVPADPSATIRSEISMTVEPETPTVQNRAAINAEIRSIAATTGLDQNWIDSQIDADAIDINTVRAAALEAMASRSQTAASVRSLHNAQTLDNPDVRARAMGEALYARMAPAHQLSEQARSYVGFTTLDLARESLRHANISTTGLQPATVIERALHTTSDFPLVFADTVGRQLKEAYQAAPSSVRQLARQSQVRDFRPKTSVSLANQIELKQVNEHGEFKSGTLVDSAESYRINTFGAIIGVTRQMLVNDDLGAFADLSARLGQAAAAFEADFLVKTITDNPKLADGKAIFHADHGNLAAAGAAIAEGSVSAARLALRKQTDAGANLISVTPKFLLVGPEIETVAEKFLATINPAETSNVNPFSGKLTLVVEPRLTGKQWYIAASPAEVPALEFSYLAGEPGPQVAQDIGFDVDGLRFRVREDFGAGWLDHRGWFKNAGA